jgi:hypothetical protein
MRPTRSWRRRLRSNAARTFGEACDTEEENGSQAAAYLGVPTVSRFRGTTIYMYHDDHEPPHFHARYAGREVKVGIHTGRALEGDLRTGSALMRMAH